MNQSRLGPWFRIIITIIQIGTDHDHNGNRSATDETIRLKRSTIKACNRKSTIATTRARINGTKGREKVTIASK